MAQKDRYRNRYVKIDFNFNEDFSDMLHQGKYCIVMFTSGTAEILLNKQSVTVNAPAVLCLSEFDILDVKPCGYIAAQSLSFSTDFFCGSETGEMISVPVGLSVFKRTAVNTGLFLPEKHIYVKLWQWFCFISAETFAQSDSLWVCRIKKYLIKVIGMLDDLCHEKSREPVNLALDYIYTNYFKKITLDNLCRRAGTNRVTLNRIFKSRFGCTAMEYLNNYRFEMAEKILTYTRMNLADVAHAIGFEYDTYFIRSFTRYKGMSPTEYRKITQAYVLDSGEIVL